MKKMNQSSRARGGTRGGIGGGYELTDPDYEDKRIHRLKQDYMSLEPAWRERFLAGLPRTDQIALNRLLNDAR